MIWTRKVLESLSPYTSDLLACCIHPPLTLLIGNEGGPCSCKSGIIAEVLFRNYNFLGGEDYITKCGNQAPAAETEKQWTVFFASRMLCIAS